MATVTVTHSTVTGAAANPNALVDGPAWDDAHVVSGLENVQNVDTTNPANINYTQGGSGSIARTVTSRLRDTVSVLDFGAIGDGSIASATANYSAFTNALATGKIVWVPYTSSGYHLGTNQLNIGDDMSLIGENHVKLKSTATTSLFLMTGGGNALDTRYSQVSGFTIDMTGAGSSSSAFLLNTSSQVVSHVKISDIKASNCYSFYLEASNANYCYKIEVCNIECTLPKGTQFYSKRSQGFLHLHDIDIDNTLTGQTLVTWPSILIEDFAGVRLWNIDVTGQSAALGGSASFQVNAFGIKFTGVGTNVGKTFIWLDRVRVESSQGSGIAVTNANFVYGNLVEAYGCIGNGIVFTTCNYIQIANIYAHGFKGNVGAIANAHGIVFDTCGQSAGSRTLYGGGVISGLASEYNTGNGLLVSDSMGLQIGPCRIQDNTLWGLLEQVTVAGYTDYNTYLGLDTYNNTAGDVTIVGAKSFAPFYMGSGIRTTVPVGFGGTGLSSGTSGGVLAYTGAGTLASSGALTQYGVMYGGGAGATPSATAQGAAGKVLTGNGASAPTFQSVNQIIPFTGNPGAAGGTTLYAFLVGSTTEGIAQGISALSGTLSKLYVAVTTAPGVGNTITATLRVNGSDTAVTCTISGTNTSASDLTHASAITAGQTVSVKLVYSAGAAASFPSGGLAFSNP